MKEKVPAKLQSCKGVNSRSSQSFAPLRLRGNLLLVSLSIFGLTIGVNWPESPVHASINPEPLKPGLVFTRQPDGQQPAGNQPPKLEGCISCHGQIEPMHKYGSAETLAQLKDGKD